MTRWSVWRWRASFALIVIGTGAWPAAGQSAGEFRVRASVSAGIQTDTARLSQSFSVSKNLEAAPITAELSPVRVPELDGGVSVTLVEGLGVGFSISYVGKTAPAQISARIPHLFFFNQPRVISGEAT